MTTRFRLLTLSLACGLSLPTASARAFEPVNDMISARVGGAISGTDVDKAYQRELGTAWTGSLRLQFGASFGKFAHCALAWEPGLGQSETSTDPESTLHGVTPFEILGGSWLKLGENRGMIRAGYFWDYASFGMLRARYDWGGGAIESSVAYGHGVRASLGYRLRVSDHWLLVSEVRGRRWTDSISYSSGPVGGTMKTGERDLHSYGAEALLALEWAYDGEK